MKQLKLNGSANVMVFMADSTDHVTGKTALTLVTGLSKDGGAFATIEPVITERGYGWYNIALTSSFLDTLGDFVLHISAVDADPTDLKCQVVAFDVNSSTNLGLSYLDGAITSRLADVDYTSPDNAGITDIETKIDALNDITSSEVVAAMQAVANDFKADVSGLAPAGEYGAELAAIQADLDNPGQYKADVSGLATQASVNNIPTAIQNADAVWGKELPS